MPEQMIDYCGSCAAGANAGMALSVARCVYDVGSGWGNAKGIWLRNKKRIYDHKRVLVIAEDCLSF